MCGHATIAAHYARAVELGIDNALVIQRTLAGDIPIEVARGDDDLEITMTQSTIDFGSVLEQQTVDAICAALRMKPADLDIRCTVQVVSTGHSKVLVGIKSEGLLDRLVPDLDALSRLSGKLGCNGYFVFTLNHSDHGHAARGRMFAPAIGIPEDPVTGNANGPLAAYLVAHRLIIHDGKTATVVNEQGRAMGRSGTVRVQVEIANGGPVKVRVSGHAVVVYRAALQVEAAAGRPGSAEHE